MHGPERVLVLMLLFGWLLLTGITSCTRDGGPAGDDASGADSVEVAASGEEGDSARDAAPGDGEEAGEEEEEEAVPVEIAEIERGTIEAVVRSSANLEAENQVEVHSQAARLARDLLVEEGDIVERNQLLLRLQDEEQRSALARAQANLAQAKQEFDRQHRLHEQRLTSEVAYNNAKLEYEQQQIAVADARRELSYTEVRAPITGTISARLVKVGDQVTVGQHLFDIVDFDSIVARVYVPEKHIQSLEPGQAARVSSSATETRRYSAHIDRIAPVVDPRTGTVKVTVAIGDQPGLLPGMYVDVDLITEVHENAILIPKRAAVYDDDQIFVYRLAGDRRVERVNVIPALTDRNSIEPRSGFAAGDSIVVAGQTGLRDGSRVVLAGAPSESESESESGPDGEADGAQVSEAAEESSGNLAGDGR